MDEQIPFEQANTDFVGYPEQEALMSPEERGDMLKEWMKTFTEKAEYYNKPF